MTFTDSHNHLQKFAGPARIVAEMRAAGIAGCVVNGTGEDDWNEVARLAEEFPDFVRPAFGLHPWKAHRRSDEWFEALERLLDRFPSASIGECGLDGWADEPSLEIQREVFLPQLALARKRGRPVTIHALKAWQPLFEAFKSEAPPPRFLMHSFGGSPELAQQLVERGGYFSFSGHFLHPKKSKVREAYRTIPHDRLLLETDAPEMLPPPAFVSHPLCRDQNHPANLPRIAGGFAASLGMELSHLAELTAANHARFFD